MKLKEFIQKTLKEAHIKGIKEIEFDIGLDWDYEDMSNPNDMITTVCVKENSHNRIKFKVKLK